jgi:hypothetical protein
MEVRMKLSWWKRVVPALAVAFVTTLTIPAARAKEQQDPDAK